MLCHNISTNNHPVVFKPYGSNIGCISEGKSEKNYNRAVYIFSIM